MLLTISIALSFKIAEWLERRSRQNLNYDYDSDGVMFVCLAMMLVAALVGFILRRIRGWRLTWNDQLSTVATRQFRQMGANSVWLE